MGRAGWSLILRIFATGVVKKNEFPKLTFCISTGLPLSTNSLIQSMSFLRHAIWSAESPSPSLVCLSWSSLWWPSSSLQTAMFDAWIARNRGIIPSWKQRRRNQARIFKIAIYVGALCFSCLCSWFKCYVYTLRQGVLSTIVSLNPGVS